MRRGRLRLAGRARAPRRFTCGRSRRSRSSSRTRSSSPGARRRSTIAGVAAGAQRALVLAARWGVTLGVVIVVVNVIASQRGDTILVRGPDVPVLGTIDISAEALAEGAVLALRIAIVVAAFAIHTACVDPDRLLRLARPIAQALGAHRNAHRAPRAARGRRPRPGAGGGRPARTGRRAGGSRGDASPPRLRLARPRRGRRRHAGAARLRRRRARPGAPRPRGRRATSPSRSRASLALGASGGRPTRGRRRLRVVSPRHHRRRRGDRCARAGASRRGLGAARPSIASAPAGSRSFAMSDPRPAIELERLLVPLPGRRGSGPAGDRPADRSGGDGGALRPLGLGQVDPPACGVRA